VKSEDGPEAVAPERIALAKRIYHDKILSGLNRRIAPPTSSSVQIEDPLLTETMAEDLYQWSVRWMEAEIHAANDRVGRVVAVQGHLDRMKSLEQGRMVRKELADHPLVKELDESKTSFVDVDMDELRKHRDQMSETMRMYMEVTRYFRLEAEARLAKEKADH
jgi:hypothetical protein